MVFCQMIKFASETGNLKIPVENANVGSTGDSDEASPPKNDANQNNGQE
jgi:hypothetical protein